MHYNTWDEMFTQAKWTEETDALSIYQSFEQVTDGRHARGVRYSVALVQTHATFSTMARWGS